MSSFVSTVPSVAVAVGRFPFSQGADAALDPAAANVPTRSLDWVRPRRCGVECGANVTFFQADLGQCVRYYLADTVILHVKTFVDTMWVDAAASRSSC